MPRSGKATVIIFFSVVFVLLVGSLAAGYGIQVANKKNNGTLSYGTSFGIAAGIIYGLALCIVIFIGLGRSRTSYTSHRGAMNIGR